MTRTLHHRGPDDSGIITLEIAAFGHTRLSILDLTQAGHQPMRSADDRFTLVYNGEVYNFHYLRQLLEGEGVRFCSRSDTEVVLYAYQQWGQEAFSRFNGMFALAIWDDRTRQLCLARDRFGIKPLYYAPTRSGVVFGSEIKSILASGLVPRSINWAGLHEYMYYGNAHGAHTLFEGIAQLLPGHYLTFSEKGCESAPFWRMEEIERIDDDPRAASETIRERLEQAIRSHLVSDVPVGVSLSGGIDSSCITAFAARHCSGRLRTYSVGFDFDKGVNELPKARRVADHFGTEHQELHIAGVDMPEVIESLVRRHDEPFADAANIPLYLLSKRLAGSVKVILQGDGGDEIFAGYRRYNVLSAHRFWRLAAPAGLLANALTPRGPGYYRRARFLRALTNADPAMRMAMLLTVETQVESPTRILSHDWRQALVPYDPFQRFRDFNKRLASLPPVQRMLYTDTGILLPDTFLEKVDKSTMSHGIEVRVPLLDRELTDYVMGLPASLKVRRGQKKWILRRALRGIVPDVVLDSPKTGFGVPYAYWLRNSLAGYMRSVLLDPSIIEKSIFDPKIVVNCIDEHTQGVRNHGFLLWKALNLALWCRMYGMDPKT